MHAYAFFNCKHPAAAIEAELPHIRTAAQTPSELELKLAEGIPANTEEPAFNEMLDAMRGERYQYTLTATHPSMPTIHVASELSQVMNVAYAALFETDEPFYGQIVYKENNHYTTLE
jgi:hypothetical protein